MKIASRIVILLIALMGANLLYETFEYRSFLFIEADQLLQVSKAENCDIVYTSASSNFSRVETDIDKRKISQMVEANLTDHTIEAFNIPGSHAGTHQLLLKQIDESSRVKTVIATVNLRSFGADWRCSELETPLDKKNVMYHKRPALINRALVGLNFYDNKTNKEREKAKLDIWAKAKLPYDAPYDNVQNWCAVEKWGDWTHPKRNLADQFIKQYAFLINEENPRVTDFDKIVVLGKKRNWNVILHILPENMQKADHLVGSKLTTLLDQNAQWIFDRYTNQGVTVLNNLRLLPDSCFTDRDFPTEHYNSEGRKAVAKSIANAISASRY